MAQEGVLGHEGGTTAHEVGGFRRGEEVLPERTGKGAAEPGTTAEQARQHGRLLSEN